MEVDIKLDGRLFFKPKNETELYALITWYSKFCLKEIQEVYDREILKSEEE
tara:strand:- start:30562 stop:30714 length:153 start_codon:yes stop_codon:yes gene_type:complete